MKEMRPQQLSELVAFLEDLARRRAATVTYGDIAHRFQLPELTDVWSTHPLAPVFDNLDAQDHDMERPFRTTLVVMTCPLLPYQSKVGSPRLKVNRWDGGLMGIELHRQRAGDAARRSEPVACAPSCCAA